MTYDVLYIDPPWVYTNKKTGGSHTSGAQQKYPGLELHQLKALPIPDIASRSAVMFLWATTPFGGDPYDVMKAWGFTYKTEVYWHKTVRKGTGYWLRGCVEKLLIGTRGPVKAWRQNIDNWQACGETAIAAPPTGHSRKPEAAIRLIEQLTPDAKSRIELFATEHSQALAQQVLLPVPWECYGLDLGHDFRVPGFWEVLRAASPNSAR